MYVHLPKINSLLKNPKYNLSFESSATNLISNIINSLQIKSITIPSFLCEEILIAVKICKLKINFYDLDEEFNPILKENHIKSDCLFICDYFGYPIKISRELEFIISETNKPIIIDRSHSLLAGFKSDRNKLFTLRDNLFFIFSLRKFLPTINGAILIKNKNEKNFKIKQFIPGKKIFIKSFLTSLIKNFLASNIFGRKILVQRQLKRISKKNNTLNGYELTYPNLNNLKITLSYNTHLFDFRNKLFLKDKNLQIIAAQRLADLIETKKILSNSLKSVKYKIKPFNKYYGVPYGIVLKFNEVISKKDFENLISIPFLKACQKSEIIIWPYNTLDEYKIEDKKVKSTILIIPRIRYF
tara:strand:- start:99 stop:1166 length:1068 start_codon:yes stop_codon:yes gene_type:complete